VSKIFDNLNQWEPSIIQFVSFETVDPKQDSNSTDKADSFILHGFPFTEHRAQTPNGSMGYAGDRGAAGVGRFARYRPEAKVVHHTRGPAAAWSTQARPALLPSQPPQYQSTT